MMQRTAEEGETGSMTDSSARLMNRRTCLRMLGLAGTATLLVACAPASPGPSPTTPPVAAPTQPPAAAKPTTAPAPAPTNAPAQAPTSPPAAAAAPTTAPAQTGT